VPGAAHPTRLEEDVMNTRLQAAIALAAIGLSAVTVVPSAMACSIGDMRQPMGSHWAMAVSKHHGSASLNPLQRLEPITGLYQFTFTSKGSDGIPDGAVVDQGYVTWHADGTEIMNSGRSPMSGDFCMGVWEQTSARGYMLNHYATAWDPTGTEYVGPANIRENVQLARDGDSYSGNFTLDQYAQDGTTLLAHVQGTVSAARITADSN
jgi:hypothetical protein